MEDTTNQLLEEAMASPGDPGPLLVLGDALQDRGHMLGVPLTALLLARTEEFECVAVEEFKGPRIGGEPLLVRVAVFAVAGFRRALGLNAGERDPSIEMVLLPPFGGNGQFEMGSQNRREEQPVHTVSLQPFLIGRTNLTTAVYARTLNSRSEATDRTPATEYSWEVLHEEDGFLARTGLRLPTEAEWEFACRAGSTGDYGYVSEGGAPADSRLYQRVGGVRSVAHEPANIYGLHDMHGNVKEWCADRWHSSYKAAPTDGSAWENGGSWKRVARGGSNLSYEGSCTSSARQALDEDTESINVGFRVACSI